MKLVQFTTAGVPLRVGRIDGDRVIDITNEPAGLGSVLEAIERAEHEGTSLEEFVRAHAKTGASFPLADLNVRPYAATSHLKLPIYPPEVWGCGVTYKRSADAREEEVGDKGGFYDGAYLGERPEVFFKAPTSRCAGPNGILGLRKDSEYMAPEPEFALVLDSKGRVHGYTCANDVSAWDLERINPLYLAQSKVFNACCRLGPCITTADEISDSKNVGIKCLVRRGKEQIFSGESNTSQMRRTFPELIEYLLRSNNIPAGTVLMTGTGIIMPKEHRLQPGDMVEIEMEHIGVLRNYAQHV